MGPKAPHIFYILIAQYRPPDPLRTQWLHNFNIYLFIHFIGLPGNELRCLNRIWVWSRINLGLGFGLGSILDTGRIHLYSGYPVGFKSFLFWTGQDPGGIRSESGCSISGPKRAQDSVMRIYFWSRVFARDPRRCCPAQAGVACASRPGEQNCRGSYPAFKVTFKICPGDQL